MERTSADGYVRCCAAIRDADNREAITRIRAPTLIINGTRDIATPPADGRFLVQRIAGSQLVELDAAHLSNIESSQEFNEALLSFYNSTDAALAQWV
jgi:3-oxoadipate enol-lactonase